MTYFSPLYISLSQVFLLLHPVERPHPDDRLCNDCEQWVVGGQDHELSRECNVGNKVCVVSVSAVDSTPQDVSVSQRPLMACYELIILI